jgi:hypothetical protein
MLLTMAALLVGCNSSSNPSAVQSPTASAIASSPTPSSSPAESSPSASPQPSASEAPIISAEGIGAARLGMTLGELKQALGPEVELKVQAPFIVDFDAVAVRQKGETQYYILYLAGQSFTDQDAIQGLFTDNPQYRTAEGVGPGTTLQEAEQVYGKATLSYNTQNESREYARFERQSASNLSFATGNGNAQPAGIYSSPTSEYNETQEFRPDATIQSVLVVCLTDACTPDSQSQ